METANMVDARLARTRFLSAKKVDSKAPLSAGCCLRVYCSILL